MKTAFIVGNEHINLRPVGEPDGDFLYAVYASTRADEMALVDWSPAQKEAFLRMQFEAQTRHYRFEYPDAEYQIIDVADRFSRSILDGRSEKYSGKPLAPWLLGNELNACGRVRRF